MAVFVATAVPFTYRVPVVPDSVAARCVHSFSGSAAGAPDAAVAVPAHRDGEPGSGPADTVRKCRPSRRCRSRTPAPRWRSRPDRPAGDREVGRARPRRPAGRRTRRAAPPNCSALPNLPGSRGMSAGATHWAGVAGSMNARFLISSRRASPTPPPHARKGYTSNLARRAVRAPVLQAGLRISARDAGSSRAAAATPVQTSWYRWISAGCSR